MLMLMVATLLAQEPNCEDPQYQAEMNHCAVISFKRADAELNRIWPQLLADAREADADINREFDDRPTGEQVLREAQRAWIKFRDQHCAYEGYEARGGSMETMLYEGCRAELTRQRVQQLTGRLGLDASPEDPAR
jgi:uncharacterized protein YecT (DUF1311 family)